MMNAMYSDGTTILDVNGKAVYITKELASDLHRAGVNFSTSVYRPPRGMNKIYALCRIYHPDGSVTVEFNMKKFVADRFADSYGYVMSKMKKPSGYRGYRSERLFSVSVSTSVSHEFSAVPLEHPQDCPVIVLD